MVRVHLRSSFADAGEDTHWASPYAALRRAFEEHTPPGAVLVSNPEVADLILIAPRPRNPVWPRETFRDGVAWRWRRKCVVISTDDNPTMTHKGFYTSLRAGDAASPWIRGGFYPHVAFGIPETAMPIDAPMPHLFSFLGSFATHPVRRRIGQLATGAWRNGGASYLVRDSGAAGADAGARSSYLDSLRQSKFILCPRGMCPSSVRLFETLKAGRVSVIISDDWVPPPHIDWDAVAIRINEADVEQLPAILAAEEAAFTERARAARAAWDTWFDAKVLAATAVGWGMALVEAAQRETSWTHVGHLARQLLRWRFVRRGLVSEALRMMRA